MTTLDHVELFVPDRYEAAEWYGRVLGADIIPEFEFWANDPKGPLMISTDGGETKLALFEGEPQGTRKTAGFLRVAFRVDAEGFVRMRKRLADFGLDVPAVDHERAWSIYFLDPWGHRFEVTTYETAGVE